MPANACVEFEQQEETPMAPQTGATRSATFNIGWIALLLISALAALGHIILTFTIQEERLLFLGWAAFNVYSTIVLALPFRQGEPWAWYTSWILVIGFAVPILFDPAGGIAVGYGIAAGVMAVGLLLTRAAFFPKK
jgi:hypothetical protein